MGKPAIKRLENRLRQTAVATMIVAVVPTAAAEHFKIVNSLLPAPSAESLLFCNPCLGEIEYESTPSAEEFLFDQIFQ